MLCGSGCPYVAVAPETISKARRPALSMCVIHCRVTNSRLVVPTDLDNILLTFALGNIRKRFQSTPNALETCLFAAPLDSAPMVVHAGLDFVDRSFEGHAITEWSHEAQRVAAKIEIVILELCRPSRPQHVFQAGADVPSGPGGAHYICAAYPAAHLEAVIG